MTEVRWLGGLLAVALIASYVTWTSEDVGQPPGEVVVLSATESSLTEIRWEDEERTVVLTRPSDAAGAYYQFDITERIKKLKPPEPEPVPEAPDAPEEAAPDEAAPDEAAPDEAAAEDAPAEEPDAAADAAAEEAPAEPEYTVEERRYRFLGSKEAGDLWEAYAPLYALRELAVTADSDPAAYGLDAPKGTLSVTAGGKVTVFQVGGEAYGTRDRYLGLDGRVLLLDDKTVRPLQFARSRLIERGIIGLEEADITAVEVQFDGATRRFVQKNGADRANAFWARAEDPEQRDLEVETWVAKLLKVKLSAYPLEEDVPASLEPVFAWTAEGADARWQVEVLKSDADWYARTSFNRGLVRLVPSLAAAPADDLAPLFQGRAAADDEAEEEAAAPTEGDAVAPAEDAPAAE
jgi:hypothetical protein